MICEDSRRRWSIGALANSDKNACAKKERECGCQTGRPTGKTPQNYRESDYQPSRKTVGQPAKRWRRKHVRNKKRTPQKPGCRHRIGIRRQEECITNLWLDRREDLPIDVIEKIDRKEQPKRRARAA